MPSHLKTMNETQNAIVEAHGVSLIEFDILDAVRLHSQLARTHVARYAVFLGSANPEDSFSQPEYERAVEDCLQKGWIKVLTSEDCEQDRLIYLALGDPGVQSIDAEGG